MSKRLAKPLTESATANQRAVRNLRFVIMLYQSQSKHGRERERDPEQYAKRVDSQNQVQETQSTGKDILMLSRTERSVALKHEESEDPPLVHKPHDEAHERLKTRVLQNIVRMVDVSSHHMFPVIQALW